mmetsp:Transcript_9980/g.15072  ORF Transcript_9980/g.15072 Transcript_9980/m.15072 type:complete len:202 (-) Transcript_9980:100-705(-)
MQGRGGSAPRLYKNPTVAGAARPETPIGPRSCAHPKRCGPRTQEEWTEDARRPPAIRWPSGLSHPSAKTTWNQNRGGCRLAGPSRGSSIGVLDGRGDALLGQSSEKVGSHMSYPCCPSIRGCKRARGHRFHTMRKHRPTPCLRHNTCWAHLRDRPAGRRAQPAEVPPNLPSRQRRPFQVQYLSLLFWLLAEMAFAASSDIG